MDKDGDMTGISERVGPNKILGKELWTREDWRWLRRR